MKKTGKGGITATVIKDSISEFGDRITTFELEYPRFIHGELMTHRMFSRNAMSSRAVPVSKMIEQVRDNPAMPIHWGKNQGGMQADEECHAKIFEGVCGWFDREEWWKLQAEESASGAAMMSEAGYHKQIVNRLLEPFQMMKTIVTATEYSNFFNLRCHEDAQPEIHDLADLMKECMDESEPDKLKAGEWHIPYVDLHGGGFYIENDSIYGGEALSLEQALKVSASCCAQVSYRLLDNSVEKAIMIYDKLIESKPIHASPFEHQAKVMDKMVMLTTLIDTWEDGVTHMDSRHNFWSGNFKGWIQYRQLL
jgi:hypothetical protein